jgi:predicted phage terminase large subunit-like protein
VRNLVASEQYKDIFPNVELQADSKSASRWGTNFQGEYFAIGVGGALAGRGADLFILDDPHSEQDAKQGRAEVFEPAWEWFQSGPIQRLMPGGAIIVVMCMTGDTLVLLADGTERPLREIRPGDAVATYENGGITTAKITNWQSSGVDRIFTVQTQSGKILRANARHPFLVDNQGERQWVRLRDLKPGMSLVATRAATVQPDPSGNRGFAALVSQPLPTVGSIPGRWLGRLGGRGAGKGLLAWWAAARLPWQRKDFALHITGSNTSSSIRQSSLLSPGGPSASRAGTVSLLNAMQRWLRSVATAVMSVASRLLPAIPVPTGMASFASTTATIPTWSGGCSVTTATSPSGTARHQKSLLKRQPTYDVFLDPIVSIESSGREEVFDVEVERTGNFIANGVVSHNTRWSKADLTGRIVDHMTRNDDSDQWEVVEFPAILNDKPLWPEFWSLEELLGKKASMDPRYWNAQYMQQPTAEEGALIKREWWNVWEKESPPKCEYVIMSLDAAQEKNSRADYNALLTWGVFFNEETKNYNIILLNAIKERLEFPELKALVLQEYKDWEPDSFIVEKKSNGAALYQEMRRMGVPISEFTPGKGQDKISRVNAVTDLFSAGIVWAPDRRWAREVIEECNDFPSGTNDDLVDATTLALLRFRQGGFIKLPSDVPDEVKFFKSKRHAGFYRVV